MKKMTAARIIKAALCFTMAAGLIVGTVSSSSDTAYADYIWNYTYNTGEKSYSDSGYKEGNWFTKFYNSYIVENFKKTADGQTLNDTSTTFDSTSGAANDLVTWNRIDSEDDYIEFLELTKQSGGAKLMLIFQDLVTGEWNVIGGSNWTSSESSLQGVIRVYSEDCGMRFASDMFNNMYWMKAETGVDAQGNPVYSNVVQQIDSTTDGLSMLSSDSIKSSSDETIAAAKAAAKAAGKDESTVDQTQTPPDHIVTYGGAGTFTAIANTGTADTEDFYLITNQEEIEGDEKQDLSGYDYLVCRQGAPRWNWGIDDDDWNDGYNAQITLPQLETSKSTTNAAQTITDTDYKKVGRGSNDNDHVHSTITLDVKSSWKLGAYCQKDNSSVADWSHELYICQQGEAAYMLENTWPETQRDTFPGTLYRCMGRVPYSYSYAVLSAQNHKGLALFTASEWISKKPINEYDSPTDLYYGVSFDWEDRVVGGLLFNPEGWAEDGDDRLISNDNTYELNAGFYIYYAAEGVSKAAIDSDWDGGNSIANASMTDNVAQVTYTYGSSKTITSGSTLTIKKSTVTIIPKGKTLTVSDGAALIVSEGAVLVLNGEILNYGTILVQPGGMIVRYTNQDNVKSLIQTVDGVEQVDANNLTNSCIVCDGGNLVVRKDGRIRVNSIVTSMHIETKITKNGKSIEKSSETESESETAAETDTATSIETDEEDIYDLDDTEEDTEAAEVVTEDTETKSGVVENEDIADDVEVYTVKTASDIKGFTSDTQSTFLNYGFVLSDCYVFEEGSTIINEGTISNGNTYVTDVLTGVSYESLQSKIGTSPTYSGVKYFYATPKNKNNGTYTE